MSLKYYENAFYNGMVPQPDEEYRANQQAFYDEQWDNTSARITIQEQEAIGSDVYNDVEVWINKVIGTTSTFMKNGEDFRQLIFRDINYRPQRGRYYKFEDNWWIADFQNYAEGLASDTTVRRCNNALRMIDPENGSIFSIPCAVDYDMTSPSVQVSRYVITPNNHAIVYVQANKDTMRLFKLNTRFMLGGRPFKLDSFQNALLEDINNKVPTILYLDLYLDELHGQDDVEKNLAYNGDYVYHVTVNSNDLTLTPGTEGELNATVTLNGSQVMRDVKWSSSDEDVVKITTDGKYQVIGTNRERAIIKAELVGNKDANGTVLITVANDSEITPVVLLSPIFTKIRQYQTVKTLVEVSYNNQIIAPESVEATGGSQYLDIKVEGNELILTGLDVTPVPQTIKVVVNNANPAIEAEASFDIRCVSLMG